MNDDATITTASTPGRRKPLRPVEISLSHFSYNTTLGLGTLDIARDGKAETYILTAIKVSGAVVGMRFLKLSTGDVHDVDTTVSPFRCDCGDAVNRPDHPGGCKHTTALRMAAERLRAAS